MIVVENLRFSKPTFDYDFKIDRSSPLGNPFYMDSEVYRSKVCDDYENYFAEMMLNNHSMIAEVDKMKEALKKHGQLRLFCWCAPKRCHGETIVRYLEENTDA